MTGKCNSALHAEIFFIFAKASSRLENTRGPGGTLRAIAMGVDLRSNAIDTSHALRASERAT